jgi:hypothetical protein
MKVTNIKAGSINKHNFDSIFWHPCYYAEIEKAEKRKNWIWKIGCRRENEKSDELSFKLYKFGNINDEIIWSKLNSAEFAIMLIDAYRKNGEAGIRQLMENKE